MYPSLHRCFRHPCNAIIPFILFTFTHVANAHRPGFVVNGKWVVPVSASTGNVAASPPNLPAFLITEAPDLFPSPTAAKKAIRRGLVYVDGKPAGDHTLMTPGTVITSIVRVAPSAPPPPPSSQSPDDLLRRGFIVPVVYEDDCCAVVVKPQGVPVLRSGDRAHDSTRCNSVQSALPHSLRPTGPSATVNVLRRPQPVHRLDKETGGLLLVAKTKGALVALSQQFERHEVKKRYLALTVSDPYATPPPPSAGIVDTPLGGQAALTTFSVVAPVDSADRDNARVVVRRHGKADDDDDDDDPFRDPAAAAAAAAAPVTSDAHAFHTPFGTVRRVVARIFTGRTHQIRRHLDMAGMPVLGDPKYYFCHGGQRPIGSTLSSSQQAAAMRRCSDRGMFLFSTGLSFVHPSDGDRVTVTLPDPDTYHRFIEEFSPQLRAEE